MEIRPIPRLDHEWPGAKQQDEGNNNPLFCLRNDAYEVWDGRFHSYEYPTTKRLPLTLSVECGLWSVQISHDLVEPTIAVSVWYPASTPALQRTQFGVEREAWRSPSHDLVQPQTIDPSSRLVRRSVSRSHCLLSPPWPLFGGEGREGSFDNRSILPVNIPWTLATGRRRGERRVGTLRRLPWSLRRPATTATHVRQAVAVVGGCGPRVTCPLSLTC